MDEELIRQQLEQEANVLSFNNLNSLGNEALRLGLIIGHGHRGGKYEILRQTEVLTFSLADAQAYLEELIKQAR